MSMGRKHFGNNLSEVQDPRKIKEEAEKAELEQERADASPNRPQKEVDGDREKFVSVNGSEFRVQSKDRPD